MSAPAVSASSAANRQSHLRRLLAYMLAQPRTFAMLILSGIVDHVLVIAAAALGGYAVGLAVTGESERIGALAGWMVAAVAGAAFAEWWKENVGHDWALRNMRDLRTAIFDGLYRAAPGRVLGKRTGDVASTAMGDVGATENFFAHVAGDSVVALVISAGVVAASAVIVPPLAVVLLLGMVALVLVPAVFARQAGEQARTHRSELGRYDAEVLDGVQGIRELAVFGQESRFLTKVLARSGRLRRRQGAVAARSAAERIASDGLLTATVVLTVLVAGWQFAEGNLPAVAVPVVILVAVGAMLPVAQVSAIARQLADVKAAAARVLEIVDYPSHVAEPALASSKPPTSTSVRFDRVEFGYDTRQRVLDSIDLAVASGETVALVGRSGAGKTTLTNLLLRFWDPSSGTVSIGGRDVRTLPAATIRSLVALVPQDVYLFNVSIRENIRIAEPTATDEEVEAAARLAFAHDFVVDLPDGYETSVGERGAQLSGGQRQRVAIARALLKDAPIIVMDEAAANLDAESERALDEAMNRIRRERTMLIVAHRLSTIRRADRVVMVADGRVVADGSHDGLLAGDERYRALLATEYVAEEASGRSSWR